ncbi:MAG: hypothetical protein EBE86_033745 [Hormoscilla sp. GUM202]|nr:hypothetical protein [Hormoscilla sp. GUM202]
MNMNMNRIIKAAAILYMLFPFQAALAEWQLKDEMTDEITTIAISDEVTSTRPMDFPYTRTVSALGFACDTKGKEFAYIIFSTLNLVRDGSFLRLRFDDEEVIKMSAFRNSDVLHFRRDAKAIRRFMRHTTVKLELNWFSQGRVYFEYSLEGASDAIKRAREICQQ